VFLFAFLAWLFEKLVGLTRATSFGALFAACLGQALVAGLGRVLGGANGLRFGP
jgi:hypothetical protein